MTDIERCTAAAKFAADWKGQGDEPAGWLQINETGGRGCTTSSPS